MGHAGVVLWEEGGVPIYEFSQNDISPLAEVTFSAAGIHERNDLQRLLRNHIDVIAEDTLVIDEDPQFKIRFSPTA